MRSEAQRILRRKSLQEGKIHHGFHYQGAKQAELWLEVHRKHAPLSRRSDFIEIFHRLSSRVAEGLAGKSVHVIGLGPGGGEKEAWLLAALHAHKCALRYTPIDTSLELALLSAETATPHVGGKTFPIAGDLSLLTELRARLECFPAEEVRVFTAYGIAPNFAPAELFGGLQSVLRPQDLLLLSANLAPGASADVLDADYHFSCKQLLPQYDNPETTRWLSQILVDWGISKELSEPCFEIEHIGEIKGLFAHCEWLKDSSFLWEGAPFTARAGDKVRLFFSLRYTPDRLKKTLEAHGMNLRDGQITSCGQEGVWRVEHALSN